MVEKRKMKTSRLETIIEKYNIDMKNINFINLDILSVELSTLISMEKYLRNNDYIYTTKGREKRIGSC